MSTNVLPAGDNESRMPSRFMHLTDIYGIWGCLVFMVNATVLQLLDVTSGLDTVFWTVTAVQAVYLAVMFTAVRRHRVLMCPHCIDKFPLNPGEAAAGRARFALRYVHFVYDGINNSIYFIERFVRFKILSVIVFAALAAGASYSLALIVRDWYGVVIMSALVYLMYANQQHKQLQIWCPKCRPRGDDDDDDPPQPDPDPDPGVNTKTDELSKTG